MDVSLDFDLEDETKFNEEAANNTTFDGQVKLNFVEISEPEPLKLSSDCISDTSHGASVSANGLIFYGDNM
mgnify:CR=1 FL=1